MKKYLIVAESSQRGEDREVFRSDDPQLIELLAACVIARLERTDQAKWGKTASA